MPWLPFDDKDVWLAYRERRMTSTKAADVLLQDVPGARIYGSSMEVWAEVTGRAPAPPVDEDAVRWGLATEASHREMIQAAFQQNLVAPTDAPWGLWQHPAIPWLCASCDGLMDTEQGLALLELKAPNWATVGEWEDAEGELSVPVRVLYQAYVQLACCPEAFAVYVSRFCAPSGKAGIQAGRWVLREDNAERVARVVALLERWWARHVDGDEAPPAPEANAAAWRSAHARAVEPEPGKIVTLGPLGIDATERLERLAAIGKSLAAEEEILRARVAYELGSAEYASVEGADQGWSYRADKNGKRVLRRAKK